MTKRLTAEDVAAKSAENRAARIKTKVDLRPVFRKDLVKDYGEGAGKAFDKAQLPQSKKPSPKSRPKMRESEVLRGCIEILDSHPRIAMWWRQNTGAVKVDGKRFVRFSFKGASDLMGVIKGGECAGKFLAVECKATGKKASPDQAAFLDNVLDAGGWAICVDNPLKLSYYLKALL